MIYVLNQKQHNLIWEMIANNMFFKKYLHPTERDLLRIKSDMFIPNVNEEERLQLKEIRLKYIDFLVSR